MKKGARVCVRLSSFRGSGYSCRQSVTLVTATMRVLLVVVRAGVCGDYFGALLVSLCLSVRAPGPAFMSACVISTLDPARPVALSTPAG